MHTAQCARVMIKGQIRLNDLEVIAICSQFFFAEGACEKAAIIAVLFKLDQVDAIDICRNKFHPITSTLGMATMNFPPQSLT